MNPADQAIQPTSGITRRLLKVVLVQLLIISVITVLGVIVAAKVVEDVMMRTALEGEAEHFWNEYAGNPFHPLPNTDHLIGYLNIQDGSREIPEELLGVEPGFGRLPIDGQQVLMLVEQKTVNGSPATLYLVFDEESVARLSFYFGVVPLSLALIVIYVSAWFAFRQSRKAISPLVSLARRLRRFHSDKHPEVTLDLAQLKSANPDDEINILVDSMQSFTSEINELIQRERRFTRDASHELRTPLAVIQGSAELLMGSSTLDEPQRKSVSRILRTARDMNDLVTTLLLLARGRLADTANETVSVNEVIRHQLDQLQITHNAGNPVEVVINLHPAVTVRASRQLVEAVCGNLLRNAFNYTREGQVIVALRPGILRVTNRGPGVNPPASENLFEPFVRGSASEDVEGYGVGLDLVRRLCDLYNWEIRSRYTAETGMTFTVEF